MKKYEIIKSVRNLKNDKLLFQFLSYKIVKEVDKKYLLFEIINNHTEELRGLEFVVDELYDDKVIKKSVYKLTDLKVPKAKKYIPLLKIPLTNRTTDVSFNPVKASFSNTTWENGITTTNLDVNAKEDLMIIEKTTSSSKLKVPILLAILSIFLFLFISNNTNKYLEENYVETEQLFDYVNAGHGILISGYNGLSTSVTIPYIYDDKVVLGISEKAFANSNIYKVNILADNVTIGSRAFHNCVYLKSIKGLNVTYIGSHAFQDNFKLKKVKFQTIKFIDDYAFENTFKLNRLNVNNFKDTTFTYKSLTFSYLKNITYYNDILVYNNNLVAFNDRIDFFRIDNKLKFNNLSYNVYNIERIKALYVDELNYKLNKEFISQFNNLNKLVISKDVKLERDAFVDLPLSVKTLGVPYLEGSFSSYFDDVEKYYFEKIYVYVGYEEDYFKDILQYTKKIEVIDDDIL